MTSYHHKIILCNFKKCSIKQPRQRKLTHAHQHCNQKQVISVFLANQQNIANKNIKLVDYKYTKAGPCLAYLQIHRYGLNMRNASDNS